MIVHNLSMGEMNCDRLFNLVCQYGNVSKIFFMKTKPGCAMIEMGDHEGAQRLVTNIQVTFNLSQVFSMTKPTYLNEYTSHTFSPAMTAKYDIKIPMMIKRWLFSLLLTLIVFLICIHMMYCILIFSQGAFLFRNKLQLDLSKKHIRITNAPLEFKLDDGSNSVKDYVSDWRLNRFNTKEMARKNRILAPTKVVHFYGVAKDSREQDIEVDFKQLYLKSNESSFFSGPVCRVLRPHAHQGQVCRE